MSQTVDQDSWLRAFELEIKRAAEGTSARTINTVFFGGGTPSLMRAETVDGILSAVRSHWKCSNDLEVSLEANPSSVEVERFKEFKDAGVNRVSIGVQALNDRDLQALGRRHSAEEALSAIEIANGVFDRFSFDLIYARQGQSLEDWAQELGNCLALSPSHLSLYQLTIEDGTAFGALHHAGKLRGLPSEDLSADLFDLTQEMTAEAGLRSYEISNHAKHGHEARHNQIYWNGGDWIGLGPGAHGRITRGMNRVASTTDLQPTAWLNAASNSETGATRFEAISREDWALEYILMSLRTGQGCDLEFLALIDPIMVQTIKRNLRLHLLPVELKENRLFIKDEGKILLNSILGQLVRDSA